VIGTKVLRAGRLHAFFSIEVTAGGATVMRDLDLF